MYDENVKGIQLIRGGILYPGLIQGNNQPKFGIERTTVLKEMTRKELKQKIRDLFSGGETLYYSDIAERLNVDLKAVVDVCRELQENKEIGVDTSALTGAL